MTHLEQEALKAEVKAAGDKAMAQKAEEIIETAKTVAVKEGAVKGYKKIEEGVVGGYKKIEEGVVGGYKKIEEGVVGGFNKMTDKFVDKFLTHEGESLDDAKERLAREQAAREQAAKDAAAKRAAGQHIK